MTPAEFIALWQNNPLSERAGAQGHFDDLCDLLGVAKPRDPDNYCFERGAGKAGGEPDVRPGWADVWKRGHFGWENKRPGRDLRAALKQLTDYSLELQNPPLLVVSDRERIEIHTAFTGYPDEARRINIADIGRPENLQTLRWVFTDPEKLRPVKSLAAITEEAAGQFGALAETLRSRGLDSQPVAHFLIQCLFCMFAEDEGLLPRGIFTGLLARAASDPTRATNRLAALFGAMQTGGDYGDEEIAWFNGGLFGRIAVPTLERAELAALHHAAEMDWRNIDPSIFGTLFERGLNPAKRSQLGAHYTDATTIMRLIEPVIVRPLAVEWQIAKAAIVGLMQKSKKQNDKAGRDAAALFHGYLEGLRNFRVLDPACGSGNFLYLALKALKDLERRANVEAEALGLQRQVSIEVSPANVLGIELDPYAAELARVTVWIGEIQWMLRNGYPVSAQPILRPLDTIENRDALMKIGDAGTAVEAEWPSCDAIVGNPPFLGGSKKRGELGDTYFEALARVFSDRVPAGADLVCYWFEKARTQIAAGASKAAGLVATNSIRGGANRKVLDRIAETGEIFEAWSDENWINEGAAVRVSLVCLGPVNLGKQLDGIAVGRINSDLTASGTDLTIAGTLPENQGAWAYGSQEKGNFSLSAGDARRMLMLPNPNGRPNSDVIRRAVNARQLVQRREDDWVIDFGLDMPLENAALYEAPFAVVQTQVAPARLAGNDKSQAKRWWLHARPSPKYRAALANLPRVIATPCVSKHRVFVFLDRSELSDHRLATVARADDVTFGILHSRFHELWSLGLCSWLGVGNDPAYTPSTTFETFPFPEHLTPHDTAGWGPGVTICDNHEELPAPTPPCAPPPARRIAEAAQRLNQLRENWLNPPEWVDRVPEIVAGYPDRIVPKPGHEQDLKQRTLTNLYNARPAWLDNAHKALDAAVAAAYGWTDYTAAMPDEEILRRLLALNLARARSEAGRTP